MTESHLDAVEVPLTLEGERVFTSVSMELYRQAALANYTEAEDLVSRALELKAAGHALLDRAAALAAEYARSEDNHEEWIEAAFAADQEDIDW